MDNLGSTHEVAAALGVSRQRVHQIVNEEPEAPKALRMVANGRTALFDMNEWAKWAKKSGRRFVWPPADASNPPAE